MEFPKVKQVSGSAPKGGHGDSKSYGSGSGSEYMNNKVAGCDKPSAKAPKIKTIIGEVKVMRTAGKNPTVGKKAQVKMGGS